MDDSNGFFFALLEITARYYRPIIDFYVVPVICQTVERMIAIDTARLFDDLSRVDIRKGDMRKSITLDQSPPQTTP